MSISIDHLLPEHIVRRLQQAKCFKTYSVLTASDEKLRRLNFSPSEVRLIRDTISTFVPIDGQSLTNRECIDSGKWKRVTSGCGAVDEILGNGLSTVGITEICGEAGSGKSQFCLQLSLAVQLPVHLGGLGRGAVYISTEESVPTSRAMDIGKHFRNRFGSDVEHINFCDNIFIKEVFTETELLQCVTHALPVLMDQSQVGLIVIDSVGAVFRTASNYLKRAEQMRDLCQSLRKLSEKHGCAVVCVNQVSSVMNKKYSNAPEDRVVPCLGLVWANQVNTRLQIYRTGKTLSGNTQSTTDEIRKIRVLFAPDLKRDSAEFIITSNGVSGINEIC